MSQLFETIRQLVSEDRYIVGKHASERLEERGILEWQAVVGLQEGILLEERPHDRPNPAVEVEQYLPDGTEFKAVWSLLQRGQVGSVLLQCCAGVFRR